MREKLKSGFRRFSIRIFSHLGTGTKIAVIGHERHTSQCCRWYLGRSEENRRTTLPLLGPRHFLARRLSKRYGLAVVSDWGNERRMAKKALQVPWCVWLYLPIPKDTESLKRSMKADRNKINQITQIFSYAISTSREDFEYFYNRQHRPTVLGSWGKEAIIGDHEVLLRGLGQGGFLLKVFQEGRWVASQYCEICGDSLAMKIQGVNGGDYDSLHNFTTRAIYWFSACICIDRGLSRLGLSGIPPNTSDSFSFFKLSVRPRIDLHGTFRACFFFYLDLSHPHCRQMLSTQTIVFWEGEHLSAIGSLPDQWAVEEMCMKNRFYQDLKSYYSIAATEEGRRQALEPTGLLPASITPFVTRFSTNTSRKHLEIRNA